MISKLKHPLLKSSLIYTFCDAINKAVPFIILPLLSYYLTPGDYGIVANFGVLLSIVTILIGLSVEGVIGVNFYKITKEELSKYIFNSLTLIIASTGIIFLFSYFFKYSIYSSLKIPYKYILLLILMAFSTTLTTINLALWRLEEKPFRFGVYQISQTILNVVISLLLVISFKMGWIGRIQGMFISAIIFGCFSLYLLFKRGYLQVKFDKTIRIAILSFSIPLIPHGLSLWFRSGIDRLYITNMYGEAANGLYATGFQFGIFITFLCMAFNNAFVPYLYKSLSEKDYETLQQNKAKLKKITFFGIISLAGLSVIFYFISVFILEAFFSNNYIDSKEFILWAIISQMFQGFYLFFVNYIFFVKKTKSLAVITFSVSMLQAILSYIMLHLLGPIGAAYSTVIVSIINFVCVAVYSEKVYKMNWVKIKI